jgi:poly-gamma-glutamate synthesis protein (capsule biosynthesis protein)
MRKWILAVVVLILIIVFGCLMFFHNPKSNVLVTKTKEILRKSESTTEISVSPLQIEHFFDGVHVDQYPKEDIWVLIVTGDVIPARSVNFKSNEYGNFEWSVEKTADFLKAGDLTYSNLESPLLTNCPLTNEGMNFCGDARHVQALVKAGIDVVNLANNHLGNHGVLGVEETTRHLQENGILPVGNNNNPQYKNFRGMKLAFLGYNDIESQPGVTSADLELIKQEIQEARSQADLVIVQFHWGIEYVSEPSGRQRELGKLAVDSGADLVIGNHPHWIQPLEIYKDKLITYAHGNFIFDQMWSEKTKEGVVGKYYFYKNHLVDAEYVPIYIEDYGQPRFITDESYKQKILDNMYQQSEILRGQNQN